MPLATLSSPPRRTGNDSTDLFNLYDWASDIFKFVLVGRVTDIIEITIAGAVKVATYTFAKPRSRVDYEVLVQAKRIVDTGTMFGAAAFTVRKIDKTVAGFTVTFADSPGAGNAITFNAFIFAT